MGLMVHNLLNGLRLALLLLPDRKGFHYSWCAFWTISLLCVGASFSLSFYLATPPLMFQPYALLTESFLLIIVLLVAFILSILFRDSTLQLRLPVAILNAAFWINLISGLIVLGLIVLGLAEPDSSSSPRTLAILTNLISLWYLLVSIRILALQTETFPLRRLAGASLLTAAVIAPASMQQLPRFWETDYYSLYQSADARGTSEFGPPLNAEKVLTQQWPALQRAWSELHPGITGQTDLYYVGFAGHGEQDVFRKEIEFSRTLFDRDYQTLGRSLTLINNPASLNQAPLANATNLQASLEYLNGLIQPEEDLLFLYLTSHGSQDHALSVTLPPLPLNDLSATDLAQLLQSSHFRWKIIVVSACYSGGFIEPLKSPDHLIITAARADRTSFGCSDDAELTYFGRAYFAEALRQTRDFVEAFALAKAVVDQWEKAEALTPSEPQIFIGENIQEKLRRESLPQRQLHGEGTTNSDIL